MKRRKGEKKWVPKKPVLRKLADQLWSTVIKDDWMDCCAICGRRSMQPGDLNAHHIIPRQHYAVRYERWNGISLCRRCHLFCPHHSPHQNAAGFMRWLESHYPLRADWLREQIDNGYEFTGTKNEAYFIGTIQKLREYVQPWRFEDIVGVRFAEYLEDASTH